MLLRQVVGKYPPVLAEVLADDVPGETKTVLDLGCGSGGWLDSPSILFFFGQRFRCTKDYGSSE